MTPPKHAPRQPLWLALLLLPLLVLTLPRAEQASAQVGRRGLAVATEAPRATREAMALLADPARPANAVDAAVAAALVAGVTSPSSSGIGGGGFVNYWDAASRRATILDFREVAPAAASAEHFAARPFDAALRGRAVGVPGEVRGLYELHRRHGQLDWSQVVDVAVRVAERGFEVVPHLARSLVTFRDTLTRDASLAETWFPSGRALARGTRVKNPKLQRTLERLRDEGPRAFYEGPIAAEIVATVNAHGGVMTLEDLSRYEVRERAPLEVSWNGLRVHTMPAPSAGGYLLAQTLGVFQPEELKPLGHGSPAYTHALAEAFRAAIADRMRHFGDPDRVEVPVAKLLEPSRLAARRQRLHLERTHAIPRFVQPEHGTHHLVVRDAAGNVVSLTTTVNSSFGATLVAPSSGIVLNDELDDFTNDAWVAPFGLKESPNRPRPSSRPVSSMSPTLVTQNEQVVLALGGSGGMTIATNTAQVFLHTMLFGASAKQAVTAPRLQVPTRGASIRIPQSLGPAFVRDLEARGEVVDTFEAASTAVQLVRVTNGTVSAAADPRKGGLALVR